MCNREFILEKLRELRQKIREGYKVKEISLFGSFAREEQTESSDIDLLVEFSENANLLDLVGLSLFLEEQLGQKVDVVSKRTIREELKDSILKEAVNL